MWMWVNALVAPRNFYKVATAFLPWIAILTLVLFFYGLLGGLALTPRDYQQGDAFRIIYIHVPCAFLSLLVYVAMAVAAAVNLIWRIKLADILISASAGTGALFTVGALISGSVWGKPMWGAWWVWDARLTSELILLFLYLGVIALRQAFSHPETAARASSILLLVGIVNVPVIHYSVYWWNTLHQGATLKLIGPSLIEKSMLYPLFSMLGAFFGYYLFVLLLRIRTEILWRERKSNWVKLNLINKSFKENL